MKRTIVYIDGFNLYYGAVKNTPYKWLDLQELSTKLLSKYHNIVEIKYFIAKVGEISNSSASTSQMVYLNALQEYIPNLSIYYGFFKKRAIKARLANAPTSIPRVTIIRNEEKGSDVNLAVHLVNDAWLGRYDSAMVISDDSDLVESLKLVRKHHYKEIIVANPHYGRRTSDRLKTEATSVRRIRAGIVVSSQLPNPIPNTNIHKPLSW